MEGIGMLSIEKAMESSEMGFARHKVICDEEGKPVDYVYLAVNPAFERLTGLKKEDLLNRRVTKVVPKITDDDFDWISFYGKIANGEERRVFERYSYALDKWYRIEVFSCEKDYFTTFFTDITHERMLVEASKKFLDDQKGSNQYEQITRRMKKISGARYVSLNLFLEDEGAFLTAAIAGISSSLQQGAKLLGFNPINKKWSSDPHRLELIKDKIVTTFNHLHELTEHIISKSAVQLIEKTFKIGKTIIIKITQGDRFLGDFTLMFSKGRELENENEAVIYADMVGMLLEKRRRQRELDENRERYELAMTAGENGLWDRNLDTDEIYYSPKSFTMLGYKPDEIQKTIENWHSLIHPDDKKWVIPKVEEHLKNGESYSVQFRMKCKDGNYKWISGSAKTYDKDDDGKPHRAVGIHVDIDPMKKAEESQRILLDTINTQVWYLSDEHTYGAVNKAHAIFNGMSKEELAFRNMYEIFQKDVVEVCRKSNREVFKTKRLVESQEWVLNHAGEKRLLSINKTPKLNEDDEVEYVVCSAIDITERKKAEQENEAMNEELRESMEEAKKANKTKSEFLATMSHELRTPLNGIIGFSEILKSTKLNDDQHSYIDIVLSSANHLLEIISDILDLSRIEAGRIDLHPKKIRLTELTEKTVSVIRHATEQKGLKFTVNMADNVPQFVEVDGPRLKQILLNLLSNSVKFTDEGSVTLNIKQLEKEGKKARLLFEVADTGIGIKEKEQKNIFEPFRQLDMSNTRQYGGTGLGVTITDDLLQKMGSSLKLNSTYGEGSVFYFELLLPCEEENGPLVREKTREHSAGISYKDKTILVAEDDTVNMKYAKKALSVFSKKIQIIEAKDGEEAYEHYLRHKPDLILMDIIMPKIDGYQATGMIRQSDKNVPIIAMTAKALKEDKEACFDSGMDDYLTKPVSLEQLKDMLRKYMDS